MATRYTNNATSQTGLYSSHGNLTYNGTGVANLSFDATSAALRALDAWEKQNGKTKNSQAERTKLQDRYTTLAAAQSAEQYQGLMSEYMAAMNEAMNREEPAVEPLKTAQSAADGARSDTARKQLLRRGLMSTYTRYGSQGGAQRLGV